MNNPRLGVDLAGPALLIAVLFALAAVSLPAQQDTVSAPDTAAADTAAADTAGADTVGLRERDYSLTVPIAPADTIPAGFFNIVENLGLNSYTTRLIGRFDRIPDQLILNAISQANQQIDYENINAYTTAYAINLLARRDSLWLDFFDDLDMQFREPNILRFNFTQGQKWKSYALHDLFYSTFFQELLLRLGNIGIARSRDGSQWLEGWPDSLRWKYREYRFEYLPEDVGIRVLDPSRFAGGDTAVAPGGATRLTPIDPILPAAPADSVEPPYRIPDP